MNANTFKKIFITSLLILTGIFAIHYFIDREQYKELLREDRIVEWLTFLVLISSAVLSLVLAVKIYSRYGYYHWFFILFCLFNFLAAFEEISWGQRFFEVETTGFFKEHSDQNEINLHNTFQGLFKLKTKHIALLVMFFYGVVLPLIYTRHRFWNSLIGKRLLIVPPRFMKTGFIIATIMMFDFQTGYEEEIGEFFFGICFVFLLIWQLILFRREEFQPGMQLKEGDIYKIP